MLRFIQLLFIGMLCAFASKAQISSTFDVDADGWTIFFGASGASIPGTFSATGGNPDGHTLLNYSSATNSVQSWIAPAKFLGNRVVQSLDMNLRFDLKQSVASTSPGVQGDVRIEASVGTLVYVFATADRPGISWKSYSIKLDQTGGWRWNATTGAAATRAQIISVLTNVTAIEIAASYAQNLNYTAQIDNVILEQKPLLAAPNITSISPTSGLPGVTVTIAGANFNASASGNAVYFGGVAATVETASATQLTVTVPIGAMYDNVTVVNKTLGLSKRSGQRFMPVFQNGGRIIPASFNPRFDIPLAIGVEGFAVGDLDGDGWTDFGTANNESSVVDLYRNAGGGGTLSTSSFDVKVSLATTGGSTNGAGLWFSDLDGDGKLDVITSEATSSFTSAFATIRNISTPGNLQFEAPEYWAGVTDETPIQFVGDLDGDGRPELIGSEGSGGVGTNFWIVQNISTLGDIEFGASRSFFSATIDALSEVHADDLDNDGKPELLISHNFNGTISIVKNDCTPGTLAFTELGQISVGNLSLQSADLNVDGLNDIIYRNGANVIIRLNTNAGGALNLTDFSTVISLPSDLNNYGGVSFSDMNGDGRLDILATDDGDAAVFENIYTGGPFNAAAFVPAYHLQGVGGSTYPTAPIAADFNGDMKADIIMAVTNTTPDRVSIYQNINVHSPEIALTTVSPLKGAVGSQVTITGDYFSTTPNENIVKFGGVRANVLTASKTLLTVEVPVGAAYGPVTVTRDELTARYHLPFNVVFSPGATISASSFGGPVNFTLNTADFDIDAADLDDDGKVDVVAEGASFAHVFRNSHSGGTLSTSSLVADHTTATGAQNPKLIDLDGDSKADITSVSGSFRNTSVTGDIVFAANVGVGSTTNISYADFNHDGRFDLAGVGGTSLQIFENRSVKGSFVTGTYASLSTAFTFAAGGTTTATAAGDFDNDGFSDIAVTVAGLDQVVVFKNNGDYRLSATSFTNVGALATRDVPARIYEGDLDVDGKIDLVVYHSTSGVDDPIVSIFHNTSSAGSISFSRIDYSVSAIAGAAGGPSTISDLDGDGKPEIIVTSASATAALNGFYILKNNSAPGTINASSFNASSLIPLSGARAVGAADLNQDSKPDLIFSRTGNLLSVMENLLTATVLSFPTQPTSALLCDVTNGTLSVSASGDVNLQYQWQRLNTVSSQFENLVNDATYSGVTTSTLSFTNPGSTGTYRSVVSGDYSFAASASAVLTVSTTPSAPTTTGDSECPGSQVVLNAAGGSAGNYRWYTTSVGGTAIAAETNATYTTPALTTSTIYFVALNNNGCESSRASVTATIINVNPPSGTDNARCNAGAVTLSASGGVNGEYRWYTLSSGGSALSGEVNNAFTTPSISSTTSYFVALNDGTCESARTEVIATVNTIPAAPLTTNNARCDNGQVTLNASGGSNGNYRWYTTPSGGSGLAGEVNATFTTPSLSTTTSFFVSQIANNCESLRAEAIATIGTILAPTINNSVTCSTSSTALTASGGANGQYRWYTSAVGGTPISGETNNVFTTPNLTSTTSYFVSINNGTCESLRSEAVVSVTTISNPTATSASRCGGGNLTLTSSGGSNGNYRWYTTATAGTAIPGAVNAALTTPSLSATTTYYVTLTDGTCESTRTPVTATINTPPSKPVIIPSATTSGNTITICTGTVTLSAPAGFTYQWSNAATTQQITVSAAGTFSVQITDGNNCTSVSSDAIQVVVDPNFCNNPPVINSEELTAQIEGIVTLDLSTIISDPDNNIDLSSITIVTQPQSGAVATIANGQLQLDYSGVSFSGTDVLTIRVCDLVGSCVTENLTIEVIGDIEVFNAVSPNGDGLNEFLRIQYIEVLARTRNNKVTILNRWGDKVFEVSNYDNASRVFKGLNDNGVELASGTYFYKIEFSGQDAPPMKTGYLTLKR